MSDILEMRRRGKNMLHEFLSSNRKELISRCRAKVAKRNVPRATERELEFGIPIFLTQLTEILRQESLSQTPSPRADLAGKTGMLKKPAWERPPAVMAVNYW